MSCLLVRDSGEDLVRIYSELKNSVLNSYRKALRMMYYADHHGFPIVTFIDTPGAYADLKSEELGQVCVYSYSNG